MYNRRLVSGLYNQLLGHPEASTELLIQCWLEIRQRELG